MRKLDTLEERFSLLFHFSIFIFLSLSLFLKKKNIPCQPSAGRKVNEYVYKELFTVGQKKNKKTEPNFYLLM